MMSGGDAAEQVVRLSLEGVEVAAKITGEGAKNLAVLLAAVLREEHKTKGKARLTNMIKSGKELKVFSIQNKDLKKFSQEAKRYGVLYCVLKDKDNQSDFAEADVIARAEDAAKIQRIMERFELASVDKASVVSEVTKEIEAKNAKGKDKADLILDEVLTKPDGKESGLNPNMAKTEKSPLSEQNLKKENRFEEGGKQQKPSVRKQLESYKEENANRIKEPEKSKTGKDYSRANNRNKPKKKSKAKER